MNNFEFYSPTCFVFGKETENKAGAYVKRFGGTKVLIHYGGGSAVRSGLLGRAVLCTKVLSCAVRRAWISSLRWAAAV